MSASTVHAAGGMTAKGTVIHACAGIHPDRGVHVAVCGARGQALTECWDGIEADCRACRRVLANREGGDGR